MGLPCAEEYRSPRFFCTRETAEESASALFAWFKRDKTQPYYKRRSRVPLGEGFDVTAS